MRARRRAIPPAPLPVPQQTPREAWDALLASLPIDDVQRRALTAAEELELRALVGLLAHPDTTDPTPLHQALDALSGARDTHARKDP